MGNKPLLSICIPTRNREKYLRECLDSIINQEGFDEEKIEIVISDNASSDNTTELVKQYQKKYTNIIYHKNEKNIWAIKNILNLPNYTHGEYVWFLSDDDMLSDIWLKTTIEIIRQEKPWLMLSNFFGFWDWAKIDQNRINREWKITNMIWMESFFNFLSEIHYDITPYIITLSIFCFKKEIYTTNLETILKKNGKNYMSALEKDYFPHSRIIFLPFWNQKKITIIEKDLVLSRWNNISWYFSRTVCQDFLRLTKDLNNTYKINKKTYRKMKNMYIYCVFMYIVITHIKKYIPKFLYNALVYVWRHIVKLIRNIKIKMKL